MLSFFKYLFYISRLWVVRDKAHLLAKLAGIFKDSWFENKPPLNKKKYTPDFRRILNTRNRHNGNSQSIEELYSIYSSIKAVQKVEGSVAEVGVYRGATARFICEIKGDKHLYLFDTFEGMPDLKINPDFDTWEKGTHSHIRYEDVLDYLKDYANVTAIRGIFPESAFRFPAHDFANMTFSFVHLDVDLYQSTLDALDFFYPKMAVGGRIISHNYNLIDAPGGNTPGVKKAFLEYFKGREHLIVEIADTQCLVVKDCRT